MRMKHPMKSLFFIARFTKKFSEILLADLALEYIFSVATNGINTCEEKLKK